MFNVQALALVKYLGLTSAQLTPRIVADIGSSLGYKLDPGSVNLSDIVTAMNQSDATALSDVLQRPELLEQVLGLLKPAIIPISISRRCPVDGQVMEITLGGAEQITGHAQVTCPVCDTEYLATRDGLVPPSSFTQLFEGALNG